MATEYLQKGLIFNIQKFSIHDGDGIRTLIFMKGCPLSCIWCSNPESQSPDMEIMDVKSNCIGCGKCYNLCPQHAVSEDTFDIDRELCLRCGTCTQKCYANAKKSVGQWYSIEEIMKKIEKDSIFYRNSGGGITIGGGEPTMQPEFVQELFKECQKMNIHTAIETCGYGAWDSIKNIFQYVDQIFFDLKHMDTNQHKALTGAGNERILENASRLAKIKKEIIFRIPLIPTLNDDPENIRRTGTFIASLMTPDNNIKAELLPYHNLGEGKYQWLNQSYELKDLASPEKNVITQYKKLLSELGCNII